MPRGEYSNEKQMGCRESPQGPISNCRVGWQMCSFLAPAGKPFKEFIIWLSTMLKQLFSDNGLQRLITNLPSWNLHCLLPCITTPANSHTYGATWCHFGASSCKSMKQLHYENPLTVLYMTLSNYPVDIMVRFCHGIRHRTIHCQLAEDWSILLVLCHGRN